MLSFVARRLAQSVVVIFGALTLAFVVIRLLPGDTVAAMFAGTSTPQAVRDAVRHDMLLDSSWWQQYLGYLDNIAHGRLGTSVTHGDGVGYELRQQVLPTVELGLAAVALAITFGVWAGVVAARRPERLLDRVITTVQVVSISLPVFWVGLVLLTFFSFRLGWFPATGSQGFKSLVLPAITLALPCGAIVGQLVRDGLIRVLREPYIVTARAKGLGDWAVLFRHALRNAAVPVITVIGVLIGSLLSGAVVIETLFARQGLGRLAVTAITSKDFPVVQALVALAAVTYVLVNLLVDVVYALVDPRIR
jgi:ABC-type dipeptide/oligopeptide/nickel transport system permease component